MAAKLLPNIGSVDYIGLVAVAVPLLLALLGIAWRLGSLESRVKDTQDDVKEMKGEIRDVQRWQGRR